MTTDAFAVSPFHKWSFLTSVEMTQGTNSVPNKSLPFHTHFKDIFATTLTAG